VALNITTLGIIADCDLGAIGSVAFVTLPFQATRVRQHGVRRLEGDYFIREQGSEQHLVQLLRLDKELVVDVARARGVNPYEISLPIIFE